MDVTEILATRVSSKLCTYYRTSLYGPAWPCQCRKQLVTVNDASKTKVLMQPIIATAPLELIHMDFTSIEKTMDLDQPPNVVSVLVFCDHFMKHIMAYMTPNQTVKTVAKFLLQGYISIFGALAKLLRVWGANFESITIKELCELMGIWKVRMSPYHAQTYRQVEWAHQMLMHMIGKLSRDQKQTGLTIYQNWYMLTTLWDWPSPDTAQTTLCLGVNCAYPLTFTFLQWEAWRNISM